MAILGLLFSTAVLATEPESPYAGDNTLQWLAAWAEEQPGVAAESRVKSLADDGRRIVALAIAGVVLEAHPEDTRFDLARDRIHQQLQSAETRQEFNHYGGWLRPMLLIYRVERALWRDENAEIASLASQIEASQNCEGGWSHSSTFDLSFYPSTLLAVTNLSLLSLGLARTLGVEVNEEPMDRGIHLLESMQGANGAMPYGGPFYRKTFEAGRTAASLIAFRACGGDTESTSAKAAKYVWQNTASIPDGHGSAALHVFLGACAFQLFGESGERRFKETVLTPLRQRQSNDGSYHSVTDAAQSEGSGVAGRAYITALVAAARQANKAKWLQLLNSDRPWKTPKLPTAEEPISLEPPLWSTSSGGFDLTVVDGRVSVIGPQGRIQTIDPASGRPKALLAEDSTSTPVYSTEANGNLVVVSETPGDLTEGESPAKWTVDVYDPARLRWRETFDYPVAAFSVGHDQLYALLGSGRIITRHLRDGSESDDRQAPGIVLKNILASSGNGQILVSSEDKLACLDQDGFTVWSSRCEGFRELTPPAWTRLLVDKEALFTGTSQGRVEKREAATGREDWRCQFSGAIRSLFLTESSPCRLMILTDDGVLAAVDPKTGRQLWSAVAGECLEWNSSVRWAETSSEVWLDHREAKLIRRYDLRSGRPLPAIRAPVPGGADWLVVGEKLIVVSNEAVAAYAAP